MAAQNNLPLLCTGLDEAGSRVHAFVKLQLLRTIVGAAATTSGGVSVAPTPDSTAAAAAADTAAAALSKGWSLGINFGPTIPDDATSLRDTVSYPLIDLELSTQLLKPCVWLALRLAHPGCAVYARSY